MASASRKRKWIESPRAVIRTVIYAVFLLWMVTGSFPTGLIYDLGAGIGTQQGQKPDNSVQILTNNSTLEELYFAKMPMTVKSETFASYNSYHLARLEDNSYICVFFDDYHMMRNLFGREVELPVGYVRRGTNEERSMLKKMSADYNVDTLYVLDMYKHDKSSWILDKLLRFVMAAGILFVCSVLEDCFIDRKARKDEFI